MNIMFIMNYDAHRRVSNGSMSEHHLFGIFPMIEYFETADAAVIKPEMGEAVRELNVT